MIIKYQLAFDDCMVQQLYMASNSPLIKTRRRRSHLLVPIAYIAFGIYAMVSEAQMVAAIIMFIVAFIWLIFYPKYSAWRYRRHFKSWINERFKDLLGKEIEMEVKEEAIHLVVDGIESKIDWDEIVQLNSFEGQFLFLLKNGSSIIMSKNDGYDAIKFEQLVEKHGVECVDQSHWEWK